MYKSPIEILIDDIQHQIVKQQDEEIYKAVLNFVPNVDKEELIRALQYDRNQYEKGYMDGKADAEAELVRCKDCKHRYYNEDSEEYCCEVWGDGFDTFVNQDEFCSRGERRANDST